MTRDSSKSRLRYVIERLGDLLRGVVVRGRFRPLAVITVCVGVGVGVGGRVRECGRHEASHKRMILTGGHGLC
ncbi:MAG: hypothetical protein LC700_03125 [Actinobacteria bacterium]|nr:hypothetical protein [Actinomycetota bacterium]